MLGPDVRLQLFNISILSSHLHWAVCHKMRRKKANLRAGSEEADALI